MIEVFQDRYGVHVMHAWGMTEMSPIGTMCTLKPELAGLDREERLDAPGEAGPSALRRGARRSPTMPASELPWDGKTFGRLKVRGPAVARAYFNGEAEILDENGFFDTGDVAHIDAHGYMRITDRSKDVIKSGGEWISSIELENHAVGHPGVAEAAVIGVPHPKWDERPLLIVVRQEGQRAEQGGAARLPAAEGRQMVAAGRRGLRRARFRIPRPARSRRRTLRETYRDYRLPER